MYILDNKIFLHAVKCGGTTIRNHLFNKREDDIKFSSEHFPIKLLPERYKEYETYTLIREPISWYESFYYYTLQLHYDPVKTRAFNPLAEILCFDNGRELKINEFIARAVDLKKFFIDYPKKKEELIRSTRKRGLLKFGYFNANFTDYTDTSEIDSLLNTSCYKFFLNVVGSLEANNIFILGNDNSKLYQAFKLDIELQSVVFNKRSFQYPKNRILTKDVREISEKNKELIKETENKLCQRFSFKEYK